MSVIGCSGKGWAGKGCRILLCSSWSKICNGHHFKSCNADDYSFYNGNEDHYFFKRAVAGTYLTRKICNEHHFKSPVRCKSYK